jgi:hypothetical protein
MTEFFVVLFLLFQESHYVLPINRIGYCNKNLSKLHETSVFVSLAADGVLWDLIYVSIFFSIVGHLKYEFCYNYKTASKKNVTCALLKVNRNYGTISSFFEIHNYIILNWWLNMPVLILLPVIIIPKMRHVPCTEARRRFLPGVQ